MKEKFARFVAVRVLLVVRRLHRSRDPPSNLHDDETHATGKFADWVAERLNGLFPSTSLALSVVTIASLDFVSFMPSPPFPRHDDRKDAVGR